MKCSVVIIGAGASGLMCALVAARRGRSVAIIEHGKIVGSKIRVSGGGRCNFTNLDMSPEYFISENPHFVKSALSRFKPKDIIAMLDAHGIQREEKKAGQMFCTGSAVLIAQMFQNECEKVGVKILCDANEISIKRDGCFRIECNGIDIEAESLVVATGGLSYPSLGATDFGLKVAKQFGIGVTKLKPALVPLNFNKEDRKRFSTLSGISFRGRVTCGKKSFVDDILFTHAGLSGPAILQASNYWNAGDRIVIDIFPDIDIYSEMADEIRNGGKIFVKNFLSKFITKRFAEILCDRDMLAGPLSSYSLKRIREFADELHRWEIVPSGTEDFEKAEATRGGVDTKDVSSKTMESSKVKGLYFIGEVLDVVGHLGGYNMHWAWASGYAAGQYV